MLVTSLVVIAILVIAELIAHTAGIVLFFTTFRKRNYSLGWQINVVKTAFAWQLLDRFIHGRLAALLIPNYYLKSGGKAATFGLLRAVIYWIYLALILMLTTGLVIFYQ